MSSETEIKISELIETSLVNINDMVMIVQNGINKRVSYETLSKTILERFLQQVKQTTIWENKLLGGNSISIDLSEYEEIEVYFELFGMCGKFTIDLTHLNRNTLGDTPKNVYTGSAVACLDSSSETGNTNFYKINAYVTADKQSLFITNIVRTSDSDTRNDNEDYFVYKILGKKQVM